MDFILSRDFSRRKGTSFPDSERRAAGGADLGKKSALVSRGEFGSAGRRRRAPIELQRGRGGNSLGVSDFYLTRATARYERAQYQTHCEGSEEKPHGRYLPRVRKKIPNHWAAIKPQP